MASSIQDRIARPIGLPHRTGRSSLKPRPGVDRLAEVPQKQKSVRSWWRVGAEDQIGSHPGSLYRDLWQSSVAGRLVSVFTNRWEHTKMGVGRGCQRNPGQPISFHRRANPLERARSPGDFDGPRPNGLALVVWLEVKYLRGSVPARRASELVLGAQWVEVSTASS